MKDRLIIKLIMKKAEALTIFATKSFKETATTLGKTFSVFLLKSSKLRM